MTEASIRVDPLTGEPVVISVARAVDLRWRRPDDLAPADCPLCPGNEAATPPRIDAIERDGRWTARAFANRRPLLGVEARPDPPDGIAPIGAHEIIVEAPDHAPLRTLPVCRREDGLRLAVQRLRDLRGDVRLATLLWFRGDRSAPGRLGHPHAQIVGLPTVPARIAAWVARSEEEGSVQRLLRSERRSGRRVVFAEGPITALCPIAPRVPFELWLIPERATAGLADASDDEIGALALAMHRATVAIEAAVGPVGIEAAAVGAPERTPGPPRGWYVRLGPVVAAPSALQTAAGVVSHNVLPEAAAHRLRAALP